MREVFRGNESAGWVLGFVERCFTHPFAVTRAKVRLQPKLAAAGRDTPPTWHDWFGWGHEASKIAENTNVLLAVNTPAKGKKPDPVWIPESVKALSQPRSMDDAYAQLLAMKMT